MAGHSQEWVRPICSRHSKIKIELMDLTDLQAGTDTHKLKGD